MRFISVWGEKHRGRTEGWRDGEINLGLNWQFNEFINNTALAANVRNLAFLKTFTQVKVRSNHPRNYSRKSKTVFGKK